MLEITNLVTSGWEAAIRGMRNPKSIPNGVNNSWDKADSYWVVKDGILLPTSPNDFIYKLGHNDFDLATRLIKAGPEHAKFLRMIHVQMDIKAPLYWWKEIDTYKIGTNADSCSTMHKIAAKEFTLEDFSHEHLTHYSVDGELCIDWVGDLEDIIYTLNSARKLFIKTKDKKYWWQMIQLLPSSYNQLRTWDASLQAILNILHQRKGHKLDEWHTFRRICFEQIPYCKEFYTVMTGDNDYETSQ